MRIKHIYITKEGEPMANPEMGVPHKTDSAFWNKYSFLRKKYLKAVEKYHSGLLPFEKESVELLKDETFYHKLFKPDTLIPVDLEVEVVDQWNANGLWLDRPEYRQGTPVYKDTKYKYRKILRIKP